MIVWLQHLFGICGDNHSHLDLTDAFVVGSASLGLYTLKYYIKGMYYMVKFYLFPIKDD